MILYHPEISYRGIAYPGQLSLPLASELMSIVFRWKRSANLGLVIPSVTKYVVYIVKLEDDLMSR